MTYPIIIVYDLCLAECAQRSFRTTPDGLMPLNGLACPEKAGNPPSHMARSSGAGHVSSLARTGSLEDAMAGVSN